MKKQILFLLIAIMATFTTTWGQVSIPFDQENLTAAPTFCVDAIAVEATCVPSPGPLNPIAGTEYTYSVTVTNGGAAPSIHWLVTTVPNFIVAGVLTNSIEAVGGDYIMAAGTTYNVPGNTTNTVDITWKTIPAATDVFLVTYVTNDAGCTDNIKVYKIETTHVFTLDLAALTPAGAESTTNSHCVSPVFGAAYDAINNIVNMDYGYNYIYFVVNAANFAHSWLPSFQVTPTGLTASSSIEVSWAYPDQSYTGATTIDWNPTTGPATGGGIFTVATSDVVTPHLDPTAPGVGATGECIIVRVLVDHNLNEALNDVVINFAVDGFMYDQVAGNYTNPLMADIHYTSGTGEPCPWYDEYENDNMDYTLTLRPTVVDATPDVPTPTNFILDDAE